ncbi:keratin-associated protein 13-1-like [Physeter macrocephalus]|uniref:Keratin-associated protein n=1 Tax=Physeter macrocephalus TaxID=9755 RepID=A0A2Y9FLY3_PHYMC|nr:keratin-associated protein 13-1-like [Physeter catodon]|eukprot:XP_007126534.1 keratin-associated protein 13-1-like [Physeter catodon]
MSYNCCFGNFSSHSPGGYLRYPGSFHPSDLVYSTDLSSSSSWQLGSSLYSGCQETCDEPTRCQMYCVVSSPCQTFCYHPMTSMPCSPCRSTHTVFLSCGFSGGYCLGYGSRSCYSLGCGSRGFTPLVSGICDFPSLSHGSRFCGPTYVASGIRQTSCYQQTCISGFYC